MAKKIAVLTSGGDAPGMNAGIRSIVRLGLAGGLEVFGVRRGLQGLIDNEISQMTSRSVSDIVQRCGTVLLTARSEEFRTEEGLKKAAGNLDANNINGLIAIGGDGTFRGLVDLGRFWSGRIIGVPGTIDNDLWGTDFTIGFDTAVNTALESIDRIRDTAESHERFFIIEVMGRLAGFIAVEVALAGGAEEVMVPEQPADLQQIGQRLKLGRERGKGSGMVVVAEGSTEGTIYQLAEQLSEYTGCDFRVVVLGHVQRGGTPSADDRILATRLGAYAVRAFIEGQNAVMVGQVNGEFVATSLEQTWKNKKSLDRFLLEMMPALAQ